jgi:hypothetical protein
MTLPAGLRLGPYEILAPLGAGGMGEVYRARDTRLERLVAVKILPERLSSAAGARERFEREAKTISRLSHAHICAVYDVGHQDGLAYLVLELLEGETLADRLQRGPLPFDQMLRFGAQIAGALGAAHRQGVVHRDLKPGNVMITASGVKLLDFGLAKALAPAPAGADGRGDQATRTSLTQEGAIPGTVPYMAPEQVEGEAVDPRTDIFALGAVLYEMATGRRAFEGRSTASLIAAILERDPAPVESLRPQAPPAFDHVVRVCLAKRPDDRWQSAADVSRELAWIGQAKPESAGAPVRERRAGVLAGAGLAILAAGAAIGWLAFRWGTVSGAPGPGAATARRVSILLPPDAALAPASATPFGYLRAGFAVSPDDARIAYASAGEDRITRLFLRASDRFEATPIPGTEGGFDPFFSPDGRWLGFFTFDTVRKVSLDGGAPLTLAAVVNPTGGTWCDDGTIYLSGSEGKSLWRVPASGVPGGGAEEVALDDPAPSSAYPQCLPGGRALLLTIVEGRSAGPDSGEPTRFREPLIADFRSVGVLDLTKSPRKPRLLVSRGYAPRLAAPDRIVFARSGTLMAAPFDPAALTVTGPETAVQAGVMMCSLAVPAAQVVLTRAGSLFFVPGADQTRTRLVWVDRQGRVTPTAAAPDLFGTVKISPEGRRAVVEVGGIQNDLYVYDLQDGRRIRITSDGRGGRRGLWHPDGRRVIYFSEADHQWVIRPVEGDSAPQPLPTLDGFFTSWSPAGLLAGERDGRIWTGGLERQTPITEAGSEWGATVSPDGGLVAYTTARTGSYQVFAQPNPPTGREWPVSVDFGEEPIWSRDSKELFYRRHGEWWAVPFTRDGPAPPRLLFRGDFVNPFGPSYDVAPDGRFLMAQPPAAESARELRWIQNWRPDLRSGPASPP